jgi:hypothetical protein
MCAYARTISELGPQPHQWLEVVVVKLYGYPGNTNQAEGKKCRYIIDYYNMHDPESRGHTEWR